MKYMIQNDMRWMAHLERFLKQLNKEAEKISKLPFKVRVKK